MSEQQVSQEPESRPSENTLKRIFVRRGFLSSIGLPLLAVFTALVIGAFIIASTNLEVLAAWRNVFSDPETALSLTWTTIRASYLALFEGAFGQPEALLEGVRALRETGETQPLFDALRPLGESLVITTPYIFAGLAVALGFRGGLFNIGAEGQLFMGGLASVYVGFTLTGLPIYIHLPLAVLAGILAGGLWGAIPGWLKAKTGAHEVINTIMMNYIAFRLTDYLLSGPMARPDGLPITPQVLPSAHLPALLPSPVRAHAGFFIALIMVGVVYWFLWRTTKGLEIRMAGANPHASRYAGIRIAPIIVLTMTLSGALAGMAGVSQVLGVDHRMVRAFSSGYGFDSIALALLGNSHPVGVLLASLLFGFLRGGAARMQSVAGTPVEIIRIIQGIVIIFVAAPVIIRAIYRLREARAEDKVELPTWGTT